MLDLTLLTLAVAFSVVLAALLGLAARVLPARISPEMPQAPATLHTRRRRALLVVSPLFAVACLWAFQPITAFAAIVYVLTLIGLAWIDAETGLLPDLLTLPLLWLGLGINLNGSIIPLQDAVIGAMVGYLTLWAVYWGFRITTGREGLGQGDIKLLAAIGAWLGWAILPWVLLLSSCLGLLTVAYLRLKGRMQAGDPLSFGPCLAIAGLILLFALPRQ